MKEGFRRIAKMLLISAFVWIAFWLSVLIFSDRRTLDFACYAIVMTVLVSVPLFVTSWIILEFIKDPLEAEK